MLVFEKKGSSKTNFFLRIDIKSKNMNSMKNFLTLEPGPPSIKVIQFAYYLLLTISVSSSIALVIDGITDPFGELTILIGFVSLILIPICLRILFGLLLEVAKKGKKK
jgi:hypothetical protein